MVGPSQILKSVLITVFSIFILISCEAVSSPSEDNTTQRPVVSKENLDKLAKPVAEFKDAIGIRDFAQANIILTQVRETWNQIEAEIRVQQPATHEAIEIHISNLEAELKADQPITAKVLSDLKLLETVIYHSP